MSSLRRPAVSFAWAAGFFSPRRRKRNQFSQPRQKAAHANRIADAMEQWLFEEGCDGFNIMFPYVPEGLDDFVDKVVLELQRRGLFRREYEGKTLRDNLGLPRPENQFFKSPKDLSGERAEVALEVHRHENG
jgi:hypothetical protein